MLDAEERAAIIFEGVKQAAFVHGLEMIPDEGLLAEVSGLAEWPVVYIGTIQDEFMDVPAEILQTSMRTHQKYFSLRDPKTGKMANRFALVANMIAKDGGKEIVAGNERVLRARLSDAKFFWDEDRKHTLESRVEKLKGIVFHAKLGTQFERVQRIEKLAGEIAAKIGADVEKAKRAARLAKADLTTGVVGEFPELQGVMGRYYALHDKEDAAVADAMRDHYKPVGPSDAVPTDKVAIAVALADKLDALDRVFRGRRKADWLWRSICAAPRSAGRHPISCWDSRFACNLFHLCEVAAVAVLRVFDRDRSGSQAAGKAINWIEHIGLDNFSPTV